MSTAEVAERVALLISGMSCEHCVQTVTSSLAAIPSVNVRAVGIGSAEIESSRAGALEEAIAALAESGYSARVTSRADLLGARKPNGACCGGRRACCG